MPQGLLDKEKEKLAAFQLTHPYQSLRDNLISLRPQVYVLAFPAITAFLWFVLILELSLILFQKCVLAQSFKLIPCQLVKGHKAPFMELEAFVATTGAEHDTGPEKDDFLNGMIHHCQR